MLTIGLVAASPSVTAVLNEAARQVPAIGPSVSGRENQALREHLGSGHSLHALRAYAAVLEATGHPPATPWRDDAYPPALDAIYKGIRPSRRFGHLIRTWDEDFFYVPVDFELSVALSAGHSASSSVRLLRELDDLKGHLRMPCDAGAFDPAELTRLLETDPFGEEKWAWAVLHWLARESVARGLVLTYL